MWPICRWKIEQRHDARFWYTLTVADVLIGLGSNVGDRVANMREAVDLLRSNLLVIAVSSLYETAPMYVEDQPPFLNAAVHAQTGIGPPALLGLLKAWEKQIGRERRLVNGPREIDLDLIAYDGLAASLDVGNGRVLIVPHPRVAERRFVLEPAAEIAPDFDLPGLGTVRALLAQTEDQRESVKRLEDALLSVQRLQ